jgi:hypothetical protein
MKSIAVERGKESGTVVETRPGRMFKQLHSINVDNVVHKVPMNPTNLQQVLTIARMENNEIKSLKEMAHLIFDIFAYRIHTAALSAPLRPLASKFRRLAGGLQRHSQIPPVPRPGYSDPRDTPLYMKLAFPVSPTVLANPRPSPNLGSVQGCMHSAVALCVPVTRPSTRPVRRCRRQEALSR